MTTCKSNSVKVNYVKYKNFLIRITIFKAVFNIFTRIFASNFYLFSKFKRILELHHTIYLSCNKKFLLVKRKRNTIPLHIVCVVETNSYPERIRRVGEVDGLALPAVVPEPGAVEALVEQPIAEDHLE